MNDDDPAGRRRSPRGSGPTSPMRRPSATQLLEGVLTLGREIHLEMDEQQIVHRFLGTLGELFPARALAIRTFDVRSGDAARLAAAGGTLREGVEHDRVSLKASSVAKTRLKLAIAESARIRVGDRWDSPFVGLAAGFSVPLVASGELYGVLDVAYPLGVDLSEDDEPLVLPIANHLSVALRNERLHRDTTVLRDYQAKLIEHANALIVGVDRSWRIRICNQALCALTGYERHELIGRDLRDLLPAGERDRLTDMFLRSEQPPAADTFELTLATRGGLPVRTMWSVALIRRAGQVQAVVAVGQDQTRVRELQSQVIQAEKLATLGQLAAGVVHELNNPLTSITVYTEYLLRKAEAAGEGPVVLGAADVEKLRRISQGAHRIHAFARDLVQYAKPAADTIDLVSINAVVKQSVALCEHLLARAGVTLVEEIAAELPLLRAVPGQMEQVVINLVTNAVHAVEGGGVVTVRTFSPDAEHVGFTVSDTGGGIAPGDRERIFEPFYTTKTDGKGTGLGLSIVKNIIEYHRGRITVGDAAGGGAAFTVVLPLGSLG